MNKLPSLVTLLLLSGLGNAAQAQTEPEGKNVAAAKPAHDYMMMKNGKMMMSHGGKMMPMTANMTMADGTLCMTDGTCKRKDGTVTKMKDGDHCMMVNGRMMVHHGAEKRQMKAGRMDNMKM